MTLIRVQLPASEAERLDVLFRSTDDRKLRDRLQIVRMAHRGRARQDIAADLGVHRKTVTRWINAYCDTGIDGLRPRKAKGKAGNIPKALADEVKQWVIEGPTEQGLDRANWTHEELADPWSTTVEPFTGAPVTVFVPLSGHVSMCGRELSRMQFRYLAVIGQLQDGRRVGKVMVIPDSRVAQTLSVSFP